MGTAKGEDQEKIYKLEAPPKEAEEETYAEVSVFYATDRNLTANPKPEKKYGSGRGTMSYGTCTVSIPRDHRMGKLESRSIWKLQFHKDPEKHVVLLIVSALEKGAYFSELATRVNASSGKNAFIFIHGYNVTFEDAARRTAQMAYDLGFNGAPVFYSWPSQGKLLEYTVDESNVEWTQADLVTFLDDFVAQTDAQNIFLIAHSMGNRALTRAFAAFIAQKPAAKQKFRGVILTAPDIDADVFKRDILPQIMGGPLVTLYASSKDEALTASKRFHGFPRAGDAGAGLVVVAGLETIDATEVDTGLLGHSYFAENRSVLSDIFYLIGEHKPADERFALNRVEIPAGHYWVFKK